MARWAIKLSAFQIENIQYRPRTANANADSLSRNPIEVTLKQEVEQSTLKGEEISKNVTAGRSETTNTQNRREISTIETIINILENTNILDDVKSEQQADSKLNHIIQQLKANPTPEFNDKGQPYVLISDILYKIKNSNRHYNQRMLGIKHLLVIPKTMQNKVLKWNVGRIVLVEHTFSVELYCPFMCVYLYVCLYLGSNK